MADGGGTGWSRVLRTGITTLTAATLAFVAVPAHAATVDPSPTASTEAVDDAAVASVDPSPEASVASPTPAPVPEPAPSPTTAPRPEPRPTATGAPDRDPQPDARSTSEPSAEPAPEITAAPAQPGDPAPLPPPEATPYDPDAPASSGVSAPEPIGSVTFDDVSGVLGDVTYSEFAQAIAWMGRAGVDGGTLTEAGRAFAPDLEVTRGEFAGFLYRLAGSPARVVPRGSPFADAGRRDTAHAAEIAWLAAQGVAVGERDGVRRLFHPDEPLTRGDMARMLYRFAGAPAVKAADAAPYADVAAGSPLDDAVAWLAAEVAEFGWKGPDGLEYRPGATLTRGAAAAVLFLAHRAGMRFSPWDAPLRLVDPTVVAVSVDTALNLRTGPSLDAEVAGQRGDGETLATTGAVTRAGWVEVLVDGRRLWVSPDYLEVDAAATATTGGAATGTTRPALASSYENGRIPASALCGLSWDAGLLLACGAAADLERLDAAFEATFGVHLPVGSAYRDYAGQLAATARYGGMAAVPGTSNHGWGEAIDLSEPGMPGGWDGDAYAWLVATAPAFGWTLPGWARPDGSKPEPWHLEHVG
ncbi:D-alanyl-D-alanine carboxypeptidase family protein [Demequina phytophila]|uniref:D-alanyl-D-alanine carboxypeptidase family protein n=1 Tax=Demequina phytophila TaxID=1638981 RepID=UPI000781FAA0|nr:D-alanyl-D-alanine carboxypeptidase family protein [Demequina phytophila]